jgi:hypothetical protein
MTPRLTTTRATTLATTFAITTLLLAGCASPGHEGHAGHTPQGAAGHGAAGPDARYQHQMHSMSEMHQRMMAAKTPEERRALMAEHMKAMQGGMRMMCEMGAASAPDTMKRCTAMQDMTMKMMTEREGAAPGR